MALRKESDLRLKVQYALGDLPSKVALRVLRRVLDLSQHLWVKEYRVLAHQEEHVTNAPALYLIGGVARPENAAIAFAINMLQGQGWLESSSVGQTKAVVELPQYVPFTPGTDLHANPAGTQTRYALAFRGLLCQHQRLLWALVKGRPAEFETEIPPLLVEVDVPLALAQLLTDAEIACCFEARSSTPHGGQLIPPVEGAHIALSIQDEELALDLADLYTKGDP